jgi:tetratricopeptide (TPR) repeat protein
VQPEDVLDLLASLVDKSLVVVEQTDDGTTRCYLLETLRQFGAQQLAARGETAARRRRHACYFLAWVEEMEPLLDAWEDWANLFKQLDPEADNLVAAMRWSLDRDQAEIALCIGAALKWWLATRPQFGQYAAWLKQALKDCEDVAPRFRAKALHAINLYNFQYQQYDEAATGLAAQELIAAEKAQSPDLVALALINLGRLAEWSGQPERALEYYQQSLDIGHAIASQPRIVRALVHLAMQKEPSEALVLLRRLLSQTPHSWRAFVLGRLAGMNMRAGKLSEAERYAWEAYECTGELGSTSLQADNLAVQGVIAMLGGDYDRAEQLLEHSGLLARRCGAMMWLFQAVRLTGETAWHRGE